MLVRFARRIANWETVLPVEELQRRELKGRDGGPDLRPSVYATDSDASLICVYAEHATAFEPPRRGLAIDTEGAPFPVSPTPGRSRFERARSCHREVQLENVEELHRLIELLLDGLVDRRREISIAAVHEYVDAQLAAGNEEWLAVARDPEAKRWVRSRLTRLGSSSP